jgi:hypothetical protein
MAGSNCFSIGMPVECAINVSKTGQRIKQDCENPAILGNE